MANVRRTRNNPLILSEPYERILKAVHFYRYLTALDIAYLLYSPKVISRVRRLLSELSGGCDHQTNQYLYRFRIPNVSGGNTERVYTLGARGRDYLTRELDLAVGWYFRPHKATMIGYSQMMHNLVLSRFLVAAAVWCAQHRTFKLSQVRISYDLAKTPAIETHSNRWQPLKVIPDAWCEFDETKKNWQFPLWLEIDRGTQFQQRFKQHVQSRIEFIESGAYEAIFDTKAVIIAYATTGPNTAHRDTRRKTMCAWASEVLSDLDKKEWASVFRFHALSLEEIYNGGIFEKAVWYRPDSAKPVPLFAN